MIINDEKPTSKELDDMNLLDYIDYLKIHFSPEELRSIVSQIKNQKSKFIAEELLFRDSNLPKNNSKNQKQKWR